MITESDAVSSMRLIVVTQSDELAEYHSATRGDLSCIDNDARYWLLLLCSIA